MFILYELFFHWPHVSKWTDDTSFLLWRGCSSSKWDCGDAYSRPSRDGENDDVAVIIQVASGAINFPFFAFFLSFGILRSTDDKPHTTNTLLNQSHHDGYFHFFTKKILNRGSSDNNEGDQ